MTAPAERDRAPRTSSSSAQLSAPLGRGLCIDCRTLLPPGERCDAGRTHRVVSIEPASAREAILRAVWGPPDARLRARQMVKAGGSGAGFGLLFEGCQSCGVDVEAALVVVVVGLVAASIYWLITFVVRNIQAYRHRLSPRGATMTALRLGRSAGLSGQVDAAARTTPSPASDRPCVAYSLTLEADRHIASAVMLRHSYSTGFAVQLDDGSRLEVPSGRIVLKGPPRTVAAADGAVERHLELDLSSEDDLPPVPYDRAKEIVLAPGDRVEVHGALEREPAQAQSSSPYRESRWIYRPKGVPSLRLIATA